jgi:hypothetical protein
MILTNERSFGRRKVLLKGGSHAWIAEGCAIKEHTIDEDGNCISCQEDKERLKVIDFELYKRLYYCEECAQAEKIHHERWCRKCKTKKISQSLVEIRNFRKSNHLCLYCGATIEDGNKTRLCNKHREAEAKAQDRRRARRRESILAQRRLATIEARKNGKCKDGHTLIDGVCKVCSQKKREARERRKADHICIYCGKNDSFYDPRFGRWMSGCAACLEARQEYKSAKTRKYNERKQYVPPVTFRYGVFGLCNPSGVESFRFEISDGLTGQI